jgi:hypothetical protein
MNYTVTRRFWGLALGCLLGLVGTLAASAADLPVPAGKPVLTISGKIGVFNVGETAQFDMHMLESLGLASFTTTTPWYDGPVTFEGVPMTKLMRAVAASGDHVTAIALNDYATDIPMADFTRYGVLLALKRNGSYMPVRDKGPLFIVYPYDTDPELRHPMFTSRSAWQVTRLIVK